MKENYIDLEIEVINFENADVITASGGVAEDTLPDDFWGN